MLNTNKNTNKKFSMLLLHSLFIMMVLLAISTNHADAVESSGDPCQDTSLSSQLWGAVNTLFLQSHSPKTWAVTSPLATWGFGVSCLNGQVSIDISPSTTTDADATLAFDPSGAFAMALLLPTFPLVAFSIKDIPRTDVGFYTLPTILKSFTIDNVHVWTNDRSTQLPVPTPATIDPATNASFAGKYASNYIDLRHVPSSCAVLAIRNCNMTAQVDITGFQYPLPFTFDFSGNLIHGIFDATNIGWNPQITADLSNNPFLIEIWVQNSMPLFIVTNALTYDTNAATLMSTDVTQPQIHPPYQYYCRRVWANDPEDQQSWYPALMEFVEIYRGVNFDHIRMIIPSTNFSQNFDIGSLGTSCAYTLSTRDMCRDTGFWIGSSTLPFGLADCINPYEVLYVVKQAALSDVLSFVRTNITRDSSGKTIVEHLPALEFGLCPAFTSSGAYWSVQYFSGGFIDFNVYGVDGKVQASGYFADTHEYVNCSYDWPFIFHSGSVDDNTELPVYNAKYILAQITPCLPRVVPDAATFGDLTPVVLPWVTMQVELGQQFPALTFIDSAQNKLTLQRFNNGPVYPTKYCHLLPNGARMFSLDIQPTKVILSIVDAVTFPGITPTKTCECNLILTYRTSSPTDGPYTVPGLNFFGEKAWNSLVQDCFITNCSLGYEIGAVNFTWHGSGLVENTVGKSAGSLYFGFTDQQNGVPFVAQDGLWFESAYCGNSFLNLFYNNTFLSSSSSSPKQKIIQDNNNPNNKYVAALPFFCASADYGQSDVVFFINPINGRAMMWYIQGTTTYSTLFTCGSQTWNATNDYTNISREVQVKNPPVWIAEESGEILFYKDRLQSSWAKCMPEKSGSERLTPPFPQMQAVGIDGGWDSNTGSVVFYDSQGVQLSMTKSLCSNFLFNVLSKLFAAGSNNNNNIEEPDDYENKFTAAIEEFMKARNLNNNNSSPTTEEEFPTSSKRNNNENYYVSATENNNDVVSIISLLQQQQKQEETNRRRKKSPIIIGASANPDASGSLLAECPWTSFAITDDATIQKNNQGTYFKNVIWKASTETLASLPSQADSSSTSSSDPTLTDNYFSSGSVSVGQCIPFTDFIIRMRNVSSGTNQLSPVPSNTPSSITPPNMSEFQNNITLTSQLFSFYIDVDCFQQLPCFSLSQVCSEASNQMMSLGLCYARKGISPHLLPPPDRYLNILRNITMYNATNETKFKIFRRQSDFLYFPVDQDQYCAGDAASGISYGTPTSKVLASTIQFLQSFNPLLRHKSVEANDENSNNNNNNNNNPIVDSFYIPTSNVRFQCDDRTGQAFLITCSDDDDNNPNNNQNNRIPLILLGSKVDTTTTLTVGGGLHDYVWTNSNRGIDFLCTPCISIFGLTSYPTSILGVFIGAIFNMLLVFIANRVINPWIGPTLVKWKHSLVGFLAGETSSNNDESDDKKKKKLARAGISSSAANDVFANSSDYDNPIGDAETRRSTRRTRAASRRLSFQNKMAQSRRQRALEWELRTKFFKRWTSEDEIEQRMNVFCDVVEKYAYEEELISETLKTATKKKRKRNEMKANNNNNKEQEILRNNNNNHPSSTRLSHNHQNRKNNNDEDDDDEEEDSGSTGNDKKIVRTAQWTDTTQTDDEGAVRRDETDFDDDKSVTAPPSVSTRTRNGQGNNNNHNNNHTFINSATSASTTTFSRTKDGRNCYSDIDRDEEFGDRSRNNNKNDNNDGGRTYQNEVNNLDGSSQGRGGDDKNISSNSTDLFAIRVARATRAAFVAVVRERLMQGYRLPPHQLTRGSIVRFARLYKACHEQVEQIVKFMEEKKKRQMKKDRDDRKEAEEAKRKFDNNRSGKLQQQTSKNNTTTNNNNQSDNDEADEANEEDDEYDYFFDEDEIAHDVAFSSEIYGQGGDDGGIVASEDHLAATDGGTAPPSFFDDDAQQNEDNKGYFIDVDPTSPSYQKSARALAANRSLEDRIKNDQFQDLEKSKKYLARSASKAATNPAARNADEKTKNANNQNQQHEHHLHQEVSGESHESNNNLSFTGGDAWRQDTYLPSALKMSPVSAVHWSSPKLTFHVAVEEAVAAIERDSSIRWLAYCEKKHFLVRSVLMPPSWLMFLQVISVISYFIACLIWGVSEFHTSYFENYPERRTALSLYQLIYFRFMNSSWPSALLVNRLFYILYTVGTDDDDYSSNKNEEKEDLYELSRQRKQQKQKDLAEKRENNKNNNNDLENTLLQHHNDNDVSALGDEKKQSKRALSATAEVFNVVMNGDDDDDDEDGKNNRKNIANNSKLLLNDDDQSPAGYGSTAATPSKNEKSRMINSVRNSEAVDPMSSTESKRNLIAATDDIATKIAAKSKQRIRDRSAPQLSVRTQIRRVLLALAHDGFFLVPLFLLLPAVLSHCIAGLVVFFPIFLIFIVGEAFVILVVTKLPDVPFDPTNHQPILSRGDGLKAILGIMLARSIAFFIACILLRGTFNYAILWDGLYGTQKGWVETIQFEWSAQSLQCMKFSLEGQAISSIQQTGSFFA